MYNMVLYPYCRYLCNIFDGKKRQAEKIKRKTMIIIYTNNSGSKNKRNIFFKCLEYFTILRIRKKKLAVVARNIFTHLERFQNLIFVVSASNAFCTQVTLPPTSCLFLIIIFLNMIFKKIRKMYYFII